MEEPTQGEIILYRTPKGAARIEVVYEGETFWLDQRRMADLFGVDRSVVTKHLGNIFAEGELDRDSVCAEFAHTAADGKTYQVLHYSLDSGSVIRSFRIAASDGKSYDTKHSPMEPNGE